MWRLQYCHSVRCAEVHGGVRRMSRCLSEDNPPVTVPLFPPSLELQQWQRGGTPGPCGRDRALIEPRFLLREAGDSHFVRSRPLECAAVITASLRRPSDHHQSDRSQFPIEGLGDRRQKELEVSVRNVDRPCLAWIWAALSSFVGLKASSSRLLGLPVRTTAYSRAGQKPRCGRRAIMRMASMRINRVRHLRFVTGNEATLLNFCL